MLRRFANIIDILETQEGFTCAGYAGNESHNMLFVYFGVFTDFGQAFYCLGNTGAVHSAYIGQFFVLDEKFSCFYNGREGLVPRR